MNSKMINIEGRKINNPNYDLDEGNCLIAVLDSDLLDTISDSAIEYYARWNLNLIREDTCVSNIGDFSNSELVQELDRNGFNFSSCIGESECMAFLEESGYSVLENRDVDNGLDLVDANMLDYITDKFLNASMFERENMFNLIKSL